MTALLPPRLSRRHHALWAVVPFVALLAAALFANAGIGVAPNANAASSTVTVNATVAASASTVSNCGTIAMTGNLLGLTVTNAGNNISCTVTFGSSNVSGITLTAADQSAGNFWAQGSNNFADAGAGACAAMSTTVDTVGMKVTGGTSTRNLCPAATSAANVNTYWSGVPKSPGTVICTTGTTGTQTCIIAFGANEAGTNAPPATYSGAMDLTTSG